MATINTKTFMTDDFLLSSELAKRLYHDFAKDLPIIDYHNHLSPKLIAENQPVKNITEAWLNGDHYKWRGMRANDIAFLGQMVQDICYYNAMRYFNFNQ